MSRTLPIVTVLLLSSLTLGCGGDNSSTVDASPAGTDANGDANGGSGTVVVLETTLGDLVVELDTSTTPITSTNFLAYVDSGYYDGTLIHRSQDDWVIQGGGFTTGLTPTTPRPAIDLEIGALSHVHGAISMARVPTDPNSATSQWFIVDWPETGTPPQPGQLDGDFAVFGVLIDGLPVLDAITKVAVHSEGGLQNVPNTEIVVTRAYRRP